MSNNEYHDCTDIPKTPKKGERYATPDDELMLLDDNLEEDDTVEDLEFMDFDEQMMAYDKMQEEDETILDIRNRQDNSLSPNHINKFKI